MQATNNILLIRPSNFGFNNETAISNSFQKKVNGNESELKKLVLAEFDAFASVLKTNGINVLCLRIPIFRKSQTLFSLITDKFSRRWNGNYLPNARPQQAQGTPPGYY
ncbi:MAG: hypothetical protein IPH56_10700 [Chitinophagaceae bacterium]|nr:hypothetical protein [Chitinophagaceae bacterium]